MILRDRLVFGHMMMRTVSDCDTSYLCCIAHTGRSTTQQYRTELVVCCCETKGQGLGHRTIGSTMCSVYLQIQYEMVYYFYLQ